MEIKPGIRNIPQAVLWLTVFFLFFCRETVASEYHVVAVQSIRVKPYEKALDGFKSVCRTRIIRLVLDELNGIDPVRAIKASRPDLILAIGQDALKSIKAIRCIPIVYLMVLNPHTIISAESNITGVSMNIAEEKQLDLISSFLPGCKSIGMLYDPDTSGLFVKKAREIAGNFAINVMAVKVHNNPQPISQGSGGSRLDRPGKLLSGPEKKREQTAQTLPQKLLNMRADTDAFLMIPDLNVVKPETLDALFLFCVQNKIPIISFAEKYLDSGAVLSIGFDEFDMGRQAAEIANNIFVPTDSKNTQPVSARKIVISINLKEACKLGIAFDEKSIRNVRIIE